ncbi:MAG: methionyl-tRNA formyltransferase [Gammaproteobacteria bacterium]|nr:methionyl-tRNA formyltransferase [Gammaproteobacteria bacterium]
MPTDQSHRLGFAGTPTFAAHILLALIASQHRVIRVWTQPDRPIGRGLKTAPSQVKEAAQAALVPVVSPSTLTRAEAAEFAGLDYLVVAAYGLILPKSVLAVPRYGCVNVHASLLPRWRGAAPVERAIMAGDRETGISIMQMEAGLDTGPVYSRYHTAIAPDDTSASLMESLARLGATALLEFLDADPKPRSAPQDNGAATYAAKITKADARIDWRDDANTIDRKVRGLTAREPAFATASGERVRILEASVEPGAGRPGEIFTSGAGAKKAVSVACGNNRLALRTVQLTRGKGRPVAIKDAVNGHADLFNAGAHFDVGP